MTKPIETTASLDSIGDTFEQLMEAKRQIEAWTARYQELRPIVDAAIGDATVATYRGQRVLTFRPVAGKYRTTELKKDYPDLTGQYVKRVTKLEFDVTKFAADHPDIVASYQTRSMRELAE